MLCMLLYSQVATDLVPQARASLGDELKFAERVSAEYSGSTSDEYQHMDSDAGCTHDVCTCVLCVSLIRSPSSWICCVVC